MFLKPFFRMPDNGALLQMALERHCWKVAGNRIQRARVKMQAGSILQKTDQNSPAVPVDCNIFALPVKPKKSVFLAHHRLTTDRSTGCQTSKALTSTGDLTIDPCGRSWAKNFDFTRNSAFALAVPKPPPAHRKHNANIGHVSEIWQQPVVIKRRWGWSIPRLPAVFSSWAKMMPACMVNDRPMSSVANDRWNGRCPHR